MGTLLTVIYAILIIAFLVASALILRHTVKFSYLSPRFKTIVSIFGLLALVVIVFSLYLVILSNRSASSSFSDFTPSTPSSGINF